MNSSHTFQSQQDYIRDWIPYQDEHLDHPLAREAPLGERLCECGREGSWRCKSCLGEPLFCYDCIQRSHFRTPFHRVERWGGVRDTLHHLGYLRQEYTYI
ncbi:hypothetical protein JAAARDRAFT_144327 [Jaapia argillacea MUCL 33604]|uniref:CxC2-like cysteine cluster KDZ transposase-associated domain-containing protein n=1 Tax=Jaapia argillacea MUCL 33604 TaxID=933084 RepID=A0A067P1R0_9AGAM|nr:hypothetical protein JAAARDRAFT_144327 [Jaapia argillacea MUCL 33604]